MSKNRKCWELEAHKKVKLETFTQIHNFSEQRTLLKANLDGRHRSLVSKLKSGVFPVRLETGRYKGLSRELRICELCHKELEDECHFLFRCEKLSYVRKPFIDVYKAQDADFDNMAEILKLKQWVDSKNVRKFAKWLEEMADTRRDLIYK